MQEDGVTYSEEPFKIASFTDLHLGKKGDEYIRTIIEMTENIS